SKLFWGHGYRALIKARTGKADQANRDLARFASISPDKPLVTSLTALVGVYLGDDNALKALDEAVRSDETNGLLAYHAAGVSSRAAEHVRRRQAAWAASLVGSPSALTLALRPRADQQVEYADRAVELLRAAAAHGQGDFAAMQKDADLEAVHSHPGYVELLR